MANEEVRYTKNFLKEVIFRVDYSPILKINESVVAFQDEIRSDFPTLEKRDTFMVTARIEKGAKVQNETLEYPEWNFFNADKAMRIAACQQYFFVVDNKYSSFEGFNRQLIRAYEAFRSLYKPLDLKRMGLRYVNEFFLPDGNPLDWNDYIAPSLLHVAESVPEHKTDIARSMGQTIIAKENHRLTFSYGLFNKSEFPNKISRREFVLDFDCFTDQVKEEEVLQLVETFHDEIQSVFEKSITPQLRSLMGVQQ